MPAVVVEDHAFAHAGGADGADGGGGDLRPGQGLVHALADQGPVRLRVEHLRVGHAGGLLVAVLALADPDLAAFHGEQDGSGAAGPDVYGEQMVTTHSPSALPLTR